MTFLARLAFAAMVTLPALAHGETLVLSTLDWCPFTCAALSDGGRTTYVVREIEKKLGSDLQADFVPWQRAVNDAKTGKSLGYFPEYAGDLDGFVLSSPIGSSPLGLVVQKGKPVADVSVPSLAKLSLGVVEGYLNTRDIDAAIAAGTLKPQKVVDDVTNIRKVGAGRIDAAIIDKNVFAWLMKADPTLKSYADKVEFNPVILEDKTLHVAFLNTPAGLSAREAFEKAKAGLGDDFIKKAYEVIQ